MFDKGALMENKIYEMMDDVIIRYNYTMFIPTYVYNCVVCNKPVVYPALVRQHAFIYANTCFNFEHYKAALMEKGKD